MKPERLERLLFLIRAYDCDSCPIYSEGCSGKWDIEKDECRGLFQAYLKGDYPFEQEATNDSE